MNEKLAEKYIKELSDIADKLEKDYIDYQLALHMRSTYLARISNLETEIDRWYYNKAADITNAADAKAQKPSERMVRWKLEVLMQSELEGRLYALKERVKKTIERQCEFIQSEMIGKHVDRKYSQHQTT